MPGTVYLRRAGIWTWGQLLQKTEEELRAIPGIGRRTWSEIKNVLELHNFPLGIEVCDDVRFRIEEASREMRERIERRQDKEKTERRIRSQRKKKYPRPPIAPNGSVWNTLLSTPHGEEIVAIVEPFHADSLDLQPPVADLLARATDACRGIGITHRLLVLSADARRKQVKNLDAVHKKTGKLTWAITARTDTLMMTTQYCSIVPQALMGITWRDLPKSRWVIETRRRNSNAGEDWIRYLTRTHFAIKERGMAWHGLQESFRSFKGGKLGLPFGIPTLRGVVMNMLDIAVALIADGAFEKAAKVQPLLDLAAAGNVPCGILHGFDPKTGTDSKCFLILTA